MFYTQSVFRILFLVLALYPVRSPWSAVRTPYFILTEKKTKTKNKYGSAVRLKIIILWAVIQSWNFADFDLHIGRATDKLRNLGFPQCKTIIMLLIPIFCFSVSCCRRCLHCAGRCSLCSCWRLLLRCSRWIWSRRSPSRGVSVENLPGRGFGATCCACVICMDNCSWFTDGKLCFTDDE